MMDEVVLTGYCRTLDGNRVICCERENKVWQVDCLYPDCCFANDCCLITAVKDKIPDFELRDME